MDQQLIEAAEKEFQRACRALESGNALAALSLLESALRRHDNPQWYSRLGFCLARERGQITRGTEMCRATMAQFPDNPDHYYYYGSLLLLAGQKSEAVKVLRQGLSCGRNESIKQLLDDMGIRKPPVIGWLHRNNLLNKFLGIMLARIGLR